jgi:hypothetical protein
VKRRVFVTLVALVVVYLSGAAIAQAQSITGDVAFAFVAAGKDMPAGKYTVETSAAGPMVLKGPDSVRVMMPVVTTLARHPQDQQSGFVFDKTSGKNILSEVWMPGQDGALLVATSTPHQHAVVAVSTPKK